MSGGFNTTKALRSIVPLTEFIVLFYHLDIFMSRSFECETRDNRGCKLIFTQIHCFFILILSLPRKTGKAIFKMA